MKKTYTGEFKKANMDGAGREVWDDGQVYEGQFVRGRKHGEGTMVYANRRKYEGPWEKDERHGVGVETNLKVGTFRVGEWRRGKWVRWISATQKVDSEAGRVGAKAAKFTLTESSAAQRFA